MTKTIHQIWLGDPPPQLLQKWMRQWEEMNPEWEYKLWGEEELQSLDCFKNRGRFRHHAFFSDYARLEIVASHGGIYIDADFEPLKPLAELLLLVEGNSFMGRPMASAIHCANGFMGSVQDNRYFQSAYQRLLEHGPAHRAGPQFYQKEIGYEGMVILPPVVLYPYYVGQRVPESYPAETIAVHHWLQSWLPEEKRRMGLLK